PYVLGRGRCATAPPRGWLRLARAAVAWSRGLQRHRALSAPTPRGVGPRGTEPGSGEGSPRGVGPRGTEPGSGEGSPRGVGPRGTEPGSGEGAPTPRGVGPRGTEPGSGEGSSSIDP